MGQACRREQRRRPAAAAAHGHMSSCCPQQPARRGASQGLAARHSTRLAHQKGHGVQRAGSGGVPIRQAAKVGRVSVRWRAQRVARGLEAWVMVAARPGARFIARSAARRGEPERGGPAALRQPDSPVRVESPPSRPRTPVQGPLRHLGTPAERCGGHGGAAEMACPRAGCPSHVPQPGSSHFPGLCAAGPPARPHPRVLRSPWGRRARPACNWVGGRAHRPWWGSGGRPTQLAAPAGRWLLPRRHAAARPPSGGPLAPDLSPHRHEQGTLGQARG